jgi:hypothetical protein
MTKFGPNKATIGGKWCFKRDLVSFLGVQGPIFSTHACDSGMVLTVMPILITSDILVWLVLLAQELPCPQLIFPSKTWFFGIYLNFEQQNSLKNQYLPHSESKSYQINSIKPLLIKIFPTTPKAHSNSSEIFSYNLI